MNLYVYVCICIYTYIHIRVYVYRIHTYTVFPEPSAHKTMYQATHLCMKSEKHTKTDEKVREKFFFVGEKR